jgi:ferritin-like metal-binding protein YciE
LALQCLPALPPPAAALSNVFSLCQRPGSCRGSVFDLSASRTTMHVTVRERYIDELNELYDAEQQVLRELPVMAARASSSSLRELLEAGYRETQQHIERLVSLFSERDERPRATTCQAMRSLIEEARGRFAAFEPGEVLDAALIGTARRIAHYEMAVYGCACSYADILDDHAATAVLQESLDEAIAADASLTGLAAHGQTPAEAEPHTALMTGVWSTETSGFAAVPPRADSDLRFPRAAPSQREDDDTAAGQGENDLTTAPGDSAGREDGR